MTPSLTDNTSLGGLFAWRSVGNRSLADLYRQNKAGTETQEEREGKGGSRTRVTKATAKTRPQQPTVTPLA